MSLVTKVIVCLMPLLVVANVTAHQGTLNQLPWMACEDKNLNDSCVFYNASEDVYRGTCQSMSEVLMCVRNQQIEYAADHGHNDDDHDNDHSQ